MSTAIAENTALFDVSAKIKTREGALVDFQERKIERTVRFCLVAGCGWPDTDARTQTAAASLTAQVSRAVNRRVDAEPLTVDGLLDLVETVMLENQMLDAVRMLVRHRVEHAVAAKPTPAPAPAASGRKKLPDTRNSITRKTRIGNHELYVTVGFYDDTLEPAEVFVKIGKTGSELSGLMDGAAIISSLALQYGVPWSKIHDKLVHTRFGSGVDDARCTSLLDGLVRTVSEIVQVRKDLWR